MNLSPGKKAKIFIASFFAIVIFVFVIEFIKKNSLEILFNQKPTIVFWQYWSGIEKKPLEDLVNKFNAEDHAFKVKMVSISMPKKKILLSIVGKVPPDLVHLDGDMVSDFALRNALEPLDGFFEPEYFEKFIPIYVEMLNVNAQSSKLKAERSGLRAEGSGELHPEPRAPSPEQSVTNKKIKTHQYALPLMPTCEALHINQNLLNKYGLAEPETLEDMVKIFDVMNKSSGLRAEGSGLNSAEPRAQSLEPQAIAWLPTWPPWAGSFLPAVFGGSWAQKCSSGLRAEGSGELQPEPRAPSPEHLWCITANSPENIAAWTWAQKNFARKINPEKLAAYTEGFHAYQSPDNPFYMGRIALENNGVWEKNLAKIYAPQLKVSVRPFPGTVPMATYVTVDALAIPRAAKHSKEAAEFMRWLHKQENLEYLALAQQKFSPLKNHSKDFVNQHPNPYIQIFIDLAQSPNAKYFPQLPFSQMYKREIKDAYLRVIKLQQSPEDALNELQKKIETLHES